MTLDHAAISGLDPCVHCGFCLQACPTFVATGDEADSPRGRIVLMQGLRHGELRADDEHLLTHIDRCLGCRACETACPSGVDYGRALEATRAAIQRKRPLRQDAAFVLKVMAEPILRRIVFGLVRLIRPLTKFLAGRSKFGFQMGMIAATAPARKIERNAINPVTAPNAEPVVVFRGCIMEGLFGHVNHATANVLRHNGFATVDVPLQGCCGALHAHAGKDDDARRLALANIDAFEKAPKAHIAINSAGCGAALKEYGHWFQHTEHEQRAAAFSKRVKDVTELVAGTGPKPGKPLELSVAYDPPCHLVHAQRVRDEPQSALHAIPGLRLTPHAGADDCCGSAGIYSMLEPAMSREVLERKLGSLEAISPDVVTTGNPGCIMQIGAGLRYSGRGIPVVHPVEVLNWSYQEPAAETEHKGS